MNRPERIAFGWGVRARVSASGATPLPDAASPGEPITTAAVPAEPWPERERRRDWAYLGMLAFTAILFFRPQEIFPPLEVLHLAEVSAIVGLGAMIRGRLRRQERVLPMTPEVNGLLLFAAIMLALVPFSIWPGGSLAMMMGLFLKVVLIFLLMAGTLTTPRRLERFLWLIVVASGYLGLRAAIDYARGVNLIEDGRLAGSVGGVFQNPNDLALNMVAFLPVALLLAARRGAGRAIAGIVSLLMFLTVIFTKSRGGFLGLIAMLVVLLWQSGKVRRGFGLGVLLAVLVSMPLLPSSFWTRMASIANENEDRTGSREARRTVMKEAWQAFLDRPLTGVGPGEFKDYNPPWRKERFREAHDAWLQVAAEDGLAGAVVFVALALMACRNAWSASWTLWRVRKQSRRVRCWGVLNLYATALTASVVGWTVCATFASVAYTWTFYYVFGATTATRYLVNRLAASTRPASVRRAA